MSNDLWQHVLDAVQKMDWPDGQAATDQDKAAYESGLDVTNSYRGDPAVFLQALTHFQGCGSTAYANAGIAAVIMFAAYQHGDDYDPAGLREAESYLQKAQRMLPGRPEIDHLAAKLCNLRKQDRDARRILDELQRTHPNNFWVSAIEIWYWYSQKNMDQAEHWYQQAKSLADSTARRLLVARKIASCYQSCGAVKKAIGAHRELVTIDPGDAWAWHNLSILLLDAGEIDEAEAANAAALGVMDFPAARQMQAAIRRNRNPLWRWLASLFRET